MLKYTQDTKECFWINVKKFKRMSSRAAGHRLEGMMKAHKQRKRHKGLKEAFKFSRGS